VYLRTRRHPGAPGVAADHDFDGVYERRTTFDEVYAEIVSTLLDTARSAEVVYAVPGSPAVAERTVELLRTGAASVGIEVVVHPALSFLDLAWARLGSDPFAQPVTICDAYRIADDLRGARGPFLIGQTHSRELLSDVKLALSELVADPGRVTVLHRLGLPDERICTVEWFELDHLDDADHLTSVYVPALATTAGWSMAGLERVMATLRERCPWDAEQTIASLAPFAEEEARELREAIDAVVAVESAESTDEGALEAAVDAYRDELGDVLFQAVFHACVAAEEGWFTLADVTDHLQEKLILRHPHVFPREDFDASAIVTAHDVLAAWKPIKAAANAILAARRADQRAARRRNAEDRTGT
jgi:tetrapyrrole methylase family protein / MazG family protein